ncbi:MAG: heparinase II/III family protein [Pseudomonadota bacterium]
MSGPLSALTQSLSRFQARRADARSRARLARLAEGAIFTGLSHAPKQREFGDFTAARAAIKGTLVLAGQPVQVGALTPWDLPLDRVASLKDLHGFRWLEDFDGLSGKAARGRAQSWTLGWLDRFSDGAGPGWTPAVAAARLQRLLVHLPFLSNGMEDAAIARLQSILPVHLAMVSETWADEAEDVPRLVTLSGWIHGAACLEGGRAQLQPALAQLSTDLAARISATGSLSSRNPQNLLAVLSLLLGIRSLLEDVGVKAPAALTDAVGRIAPELRLLRTGDGALARFHGGGAAPEGALDRALAESGVRARRASEPTLGYVRLHGGRVQVIADCARPPQRSDQGHASTLGFEMSSGRRPIIVNVGPAQDWPEGYDRMPRTTMAHNTLTLDKNSSSGFGPTSVAGKPGFDALVKRPSMVTLAVAQDKTGMWLQARHDGYLEDYGLLHERRLLVSTFGHEILGEDVLLSPDQKAQRRFATRIKGAAKLGVNLALHFHLHPDVESEMVRTENLVRLTLQNGEEWVFRHIGGDLDLDPSVYLHPAQPEPVPTRQIVVSTRTSIHEAKLSWSLSRKDSGGRSLRDVSAPLMRSV